MAMPGAPAHAQVSNQDLPLVKERQNDLQRRLQEDKLREDELQRRAPVDRPPEGMVPPRAEPPAVMAEGECRDIATVILDGAVVLSDIEATAITRPFEGGCLGLAEIDEILRQVTNWYMDRGFVTTRAYLPQQDLSQGTLTILVMEGTAEDVRLKDGGDARHELSTAFPGVTGKTLNIRDLEQGLDQINRVPSVNAKMDLVPGTEQGGTVVEITRETGKWWRASVTVDNNGSTSTGRVTRDLGLELDSPLGLNDVWSFSLNPDKRGEQPGGSRSASASVTVPYGYWTAGYSEYWLSYYDQIEGTSATYRSDGVSRQRKATLERVVFRDQDSKTSLEAALTNKQVRNYIEHAKLAVQSRKLTIGELTLRHATKLAGGALNLSGSHAWGLRGLGAYKDHRNPTGASAQFSKWAANVSYMRPFTVAEQDLRLSLSASGQWTPDTLFSSERIGVGGRSTVRGFRDQTASGDVGGYGRAELSWTLPATESAAFDRALGRVSLYAGADAGHIRRDYSETEEYGTLSGAAVGLRTGGGIASLDVAYARPLAQPAYITTGGGEVYASVKLTY